MSKERRSEGKSRTPGLLLAVLCLAVFLSACNGEPPSAERAIVDGAGRPSADRDLGEIEESGVLRVLFTYNSTGYFIYRGEVMGFEFRLLRAFAEDRGLALEGEVLDRRSELFPALHRGEGDVVAARLLADEVDREGIVATQPLYRTPPTVIQPEPPPIPSPLDLPPPVQDVRDGPGELAPIALRVRPVRRRWELAGKTVHVPDGSPYTDDLLELSNRMTGDFEVVEVENARSTEALIRRLARDGITLTVGPENVAELSEEYFRAIETRPVVGPPDPVVWGVRASSPELLRALNRWIASHPEKVREEYETYFEDREAFRERVVSEYLTTETGRLSPYDELIRAEVAKLGWDWRLLASQVFQESRFDPEARSWAGAQGLLQLMPTTAEEVRVDDPFDAEENLAGGVRYLRWLNRLWSRDLGEDHPDLTKFVLASYNAGRGHVRDAAKLAEKYGDDPGSWDDVAYWLLQLGKRRYYTDPVVEYGFCRGLEPVTYVALIQERYRHYLRFVEDGASGSGVAAAG